LFFFFYIKGTEFFQFDELQNEDGGIINRAWTSEIPQLEKLEHSFPNRIWSWSEVALVFRSLVLSGCNISDLDKDMLLYTNVTRLDVSSNKLTHIEELPPNIVGLFLNCNPLSRMAFNNISAPFLRFLDISYCELTSIPNLDPNEFPALCAIDLSGNDICDMESLNQLQILPQLSHVCLINNPLVLQPNYQAQVLDILPKLTHLDDIQVTSMDIKKNVVDSSDEIGKNKMMFRVTVTSLWGLPEAPSVPNVDIFGQIQIKFNNEEAVTSVIPWDRSLIMEEGDEPDTVVPVEAIKSDKKKGKGKVEEVVPVVSTIDRSIPQILELKFDISSMLRDSILFDDVNISVIRLKREHRSEDEAAEAEATTSEVESEVLGEGSFSVKQVLGSAYKSKTGKIKEVVSIPCEGCEDGEPSLMKLQLQLVH
jgi:hypothetical protein